MGWVSNNRKLSIIRPRYLAKLAHTSMIAEKIRRQTVYQFPRLFHFHFPIFPTNVFSYAAPPAGNFRPKFIISAECAADLLPL